MKVASLRLTCKIRYVEKRIDFIEFYKVLTTGSILMNLKEKSICCFFGHRDTPEQSIPILKTEIERLIIEENVTEFLVGGYGKFDGYTTSIINSLKKKYDIKLIFVTAYLSTLKSKKDYITHTYDETIYPDGLEIVPQKFAITKRNLWIVEQCQYGIFYVKHCYGHAYTALKYAKKRNLKIINIADIENKKGIVHMRSSFFIFAFLFVFVI